MPLPTKGPIPSLGGAVVRYRPIVPVGVFGAFGLRFIDGCVDCGSDDSIFPLSLARKLRLDLTGAPQGESYPVCSVTRDFLTFSTPTCAAPGARFS